MTAETQAVSTLTAVPERLRRLWSEASPVSIAVAVTALSAAMLFVTVDAVRTALETEPLTLITAEIAEPEVLGNALVASASAMTGAPGVTVLGTGAVADGVAAMMGVAQRGLGAFGTAFLASAVAFRRRPRPVSVHPAVAQQPADLLRALPTGMALWDDSAKLVACNERYLGQLMWGEPDIAPGAPYENAVKRLIRGGTVVVLKEDEECRIIEVKRPDGAFLMIEERALASGGFITMVSDRTERRRDELLLASVQHEQRQLARQYHAEKLKAEAANRSKTAFLAHLSHDIRTPLNHIIGFAELIRHQTYGPIGDARYLNYVDTIKGSGERLLGFFASIMDLAELESGQKELHLERVEIDELLETVGRRFKPQAGRAGVSLRLGVASGAVLTADRFCLERMLGNVVENALRFTPSGGRVSLAAYAASDGVVLEIADTGIGMSEERLAELSQPFGFSDASLTREQGGAGLGLPIARAIAEQSGGNLAIDSRPGLGTTVAISLPLAEGASLPPRVKAA